MIDQSHHRAPANIRDHVAFLFVKALRFFADLFFRKQATHQARHCSHRFEDDSPVAVSFPEEEVGEKPQCLASWVACFNTSKRCA